MSAFEYTIYGIRRGWRVSRSFLFVGMFSAAVVAGVFTQLAGDPDRKVTAAILFSFWAVVFGMRGHRRVTAEYQKLTIKSKLDLELGLLLVVATHAVVQLAGGLSSPLYPLVFVLVAFLVVYTPQWVGMTLAASTAVLELSIVHFNPHQGAMPTAIAHSVFIAFFALINLVFTRTEVARLRNRAKRKLEEAEAAVINDARDFRLTAPAIGNTGTVSRREEENRLSRSAVGELRRAMYHHVDLLKRTMDLYSCLLLWLDPRGDRLRILECVTDAENISEKRIAKGQGAIGAVLQSQKPLRLKGLRPGYPGLPYYRGGAPVTDFLGVPVMEGDSLRGVLCADRRDGQPFTDVDVENLSSAIESLLRLVANERVFTQLQKAKSEQSKLLSASESLSRALSETEVVEAALEAAGRIAPFDIAAVALVDKSGSQVVRKAVGEGAEALAGIKAVRGSGLAASALKTRHCLPYRGEFDPATQILLSAKTQKHFAKMRSALVVPLVAAGDEVLGTLTLASQQPSAYGEDVRTTLQVMTNQLGTALSNAQMVRQLEEMATIDQLTGLPNRRLFKTELEKKMASAHRFNKVLSVIVCDVDKFKGVNDTYGHMVGDVVLRGLGECLRKNVVRDTDLPARFGGEEFVILCEGTDTDGAVQLAERIRKDLESRVFHSDQGELGVTISMGVATFPLHARNQDALVERADEALYAAKHGGRNQVKTWSRELSSGLQKTA